MCLSTNFEFIYTKILIFTAIEPELLKISALNVILKIINFGFGPDKYMSTGGYVPVLIKERIIFVVVIEEPV